MQTTSLRAKITPSQGVNFVVVSNPGTLFERIEDYCQTMKSAIECKDCYDEPTDIMKVLPSGALTTEF